MKRSLGIGLMVVLMSFALAIMAYGADRLIVQDTGGNTKFVVTDEGKVGIFTTTPEASLHLTEQTTSPSRGLLSAQHNNGAQAAYILFRKSRGTEASPSAVAFGDFIGFVDNQGYDGTAYQNSASFGYTVDGTVSAGSVPMAFVVYTGYKIGVPGRAERFRISSTGNVGIGTQSPAYPLHMASGARCTTGGVWTNASSKEYKENISDLSADQALLAFNKLNPVTFNYKADAEEKHVGFIAEDVPDLVATPDRKGLSTMDIVAVLTKVVQEQQKVIAELKDKVNQLEQQVK